MTSLTFALRGNGFVIFDKGEIIFRINVFSEASLWKVMPF